ncbi:hypothetical protein ACEQPO_28955 [Bacillus sp. SL00103]
MKLRYCMAEHVFPKAHANSALLPEETYQLIQDIDAFTYKASGLIIEIGLNDWSPMLHCMQEN